MAAVDVTATPTSNRRTQKGYNRSLQSLFDDEKELYRRADGRAESNRLRAQTSIVAFHPRGRSPVDLSPPGRQGDNESPSCSATAWMARAE